MSNQSESVAKLADALSKAQKAIKPPVKNKTAKIEKKSGGSFSYKYSDLADLIEALREPFAENGLSHSQAPQYEDGTLVLVTRIMHASGEWVRGSFPLPTLSAQEMGSAITYARRFSLGAMAGVAADDDDDGEAAQQAKAQPARKPEPKPAPATLPLSDEEQQKVANWEASLETHHSPEQLAVARDKAGAIRSAVLKAAVMAVIERWAKA